MLNLPLGAGLPEGMRQRLGNLETRTAVSLEEIAAWVQAGFPTATAFRTYTLASGIARHAEITTPSSGESAN